jgi:adenylate cyclase
MAVRVGCGPFYDPNVTRRIELPARLPVVLRTAVGLPALCLGTSVVGASLVGGLALLSGVIGSFGPHWFTVVVFVVGWLALSLVAGSVWTLVVQRRTVMWFAAGREPTVADARRTLRLPADVARVSGTLWLIGAIVIGGAIGLVGPFSLAATTFFTVLLGGILTAGVTYLGVERAARSILSTALQVVSSHEALSVTVLTRLLITWAVASGVPLLGLLLMGLFPIVDFRTLALDMVAVSAFALVVGAIATWLLARSVAVPLRRLRVAVENVAHGDNAVRVPVDDSSEIGLLQRSVNDLTRALRDRDRIHDLFGRHVGPDVAQRAVTEDAGAALTGDVRHVAALFVDVVGSTKLAHHLPPEEMVQKLNRLFTSVVDAVAEHGGLVNKFIGDAALCVFGAPDTMDDPATAALRTARRIRDEVRAAGELDVGIGVAAGPVFAGDIGAKERLEYTVIGDPVNEAARLTDQAKHVPGRILASNAVLDTCDPAEATRWMPHEDIQLRGRAVTTTTWVDSTQAA